MCGQVPDIYALCGCVRIGKIIVCAWFSSYVNEFLRETWYNWFLKVSFREYELHFIYEFQNICNSMSLNYSILKMLEVHILVHACYVWWTLLYIYWDNVLINVFINFQMLAARKQEEGTILSDPIFLDICSCNYLIL